MAEPPGGLEAGSPLGSRFGARTLFAKYLRIYPATNTDPSAAMTAPYFECMTGAEAPRGPRDARPAHGDLTRKPLKLCFTSSSSSLSSIPSTPDAPHSISLRMGELAVVESAEAKHAGVGESERRAPLDGKEGEQDQCGTESGRGERGARRRARAKCGWGVESPPGATTRTRMEEGLRHEGTGYGGGSTGRRSRAGCAGTSRRGVRRR